MFIYFKNIEVLYDVLQSLLQKFIFENSFINHKSQAYINLKSMTYGRYVQWDGFC